MSTLRQASFPIPYFKLFYNCIVKFMYSPLDHNCDQSQSICNPMETTHVTQLEMTTGYLCYSNKYCSASKW